MYEYYVLCSIKSFSMDGLSMVLDSVKILYIQMNSFDLNTIIGLLQCFPCMEKLLWQETTATYGTKGPLLVRRGDVALHKEQTCNAHDAAIAPTCRGTT